METVNVAVVSSNFAILFRTLFRRRMHRGLGTTKFFAQFPKPATTGIKFNALLPELRHVRRLSLCIDLGVCRIIGQMKLK